MRLCETSNAAAAIPAPVRASETCAVAGFGDPAANLPNASVTVFLVLSVAAAAAAADAVPDVSASGPAAFVAGAADRASVAAGPAEAAVDGAADNVPLTQPDKPAASAVAATAANNRRAALGGATPGAPAPGMLAGGLSGEAPPVGLCRWSGVCRMVSFCHAAWSGSATWAGSARPGGAAPLPAKEPWEPLRGTLIGKY